MDLIEVKSTTKLKKEVHLPDIAFQAFVLAGAGIKVRKCFLAHINNEFVRHGAIDPQKFFTLEEVTAQVSVLSREFEEQLDAMQRIIGATAHPEIQIGPHCDDPYTCPLHERCWSFLPESNVFTLYRDGKNSFALLKQGIQHLEEIPADFALTDNQAIQRTASREFLRVTYGQVTAAECRRVRQHLKEYCGLDTMGMVQIAGALTKLTA